MHSLVVHQGREVLEVLEVPQHPEKRINTNTISSIFSICLKIGDSFPDCVKVRANLQHLRSAKSHSCYSHV